MTTSTSTPLVSHDTIHNLPLAAILPNPHQPRTRFAQGALDELAASIATHGVQQPITVTATGDGTYTLVAGERRTRAARQAGLSEIPALVRTGDAAILALVENLQREDLDSLEEAAAYRALLARGETQQGLAAKLGVSRDRIAQKVRLLDLGREGRESLASGRLSDGAARQLLRLGIFDDLATRPVADLFGAEWESWADHFAKLVLWTPYFAITVADVQFAVDELLSDLYAANDRPLEGIEERFHALWKKARAGKVYSIYDREDLILFKTLPDFSRLTDYQRQELARSYCRWFEEYCRRHPDCE